MPERFLLFLAVVLPTLAIAWGRSELSTYVLYREPKLAAASMAVALLIAWLAWRRPQVLSADSLAAALRPPAARLGSAWILWAALTGLWVKVGELYLYELRQWLLFGAFWVVLVAWIRHEPAVRAALRAGLITSAVLITAGGAAQASGLLPALSEFLLPIDPQIGSAFGSFMGYKNPAALAVAGQFFILLGAFAAARSSGLRLWIGLWIAAELAYLAALQSRTVYGALVLGIVGLAGFGLLHPRGRRLAAPVLGIAVIFVAGLLLHPSTADRARSIQPLLTTEGYLSSDRGVYFRNTLNMVDHHPFGVGLGQWQVHYPVFRRVDRYRSFDDDFQVRRAHSDHVQTLGETSLPGLFLWTAWLATLIGTALRRYVRDGDLESLFLAAQMLAWSGAMAADYVVEMPFHKFQLLLVAALVSTSSPSSPPKRSRKHATRPSLSKALFLTGLAAWVGFDQAQTLRRHQLAAELTGRYLSMVESHQRRESIDPDRIEAARRLGSELGHPPSKTGFRSYLIRAELALWMDDHGDAQSLVACALELHPYSPNALALMAEAVSERESARWLRAAQQVKHEAETGFAGRMPTPRVPCDH